MISREFAENLSAGVEERVPFFSLKNDRDESVIRLLYRSYDEMLEKASFAVHKVKGISKSGKAYYTDIACKRTSYADPISVCPLCTQSANAMDTDGSVSRTKAILNLMVYNEVAKRVEVWQKSWSWVSSQLSFAMEEDGVNKEELHKYPLRVVRQGASGSLHTTYSLRFKEPKDFDISSYVNIPQVKPDAQPTQSTQPTQPTQPTQVSSSNNTMNDIFRGM